MDKDRTVCVKRTGVTRPSSWTKHLARAERKSSWCTRLTEVICWWPLAVASITLFPARFNASIQLKTMPLSKALQIYITISSVPWKKGLTNCFLFRCLQITQFSTVHFDGTNSTPMAENFRPAQFLNEREVYWSSASILLPTAKLLLLLLMLTYILSSLCQWTLLTSFKVLAFLEGFLLLLLLLVLCTK